MPSDIELTSLSHAELVALVQQLRQQVAERDQEIGCLKAQLIQQKTLPTADRPMLQPPPATMDESPSGSQEDLLAQLEKIYPA
jgi:hypothetical protein